MKTFLTLFFLVFSNSLFAQKTEILHAVNSLGAPIYSAPSFDSQLVGLVEASNNIYVDKTIDKKVKKRISKDLELEGSWYQLNLDLNFGYVHSSDFSAKPTELIIEHSDLQTVKLFGKELEKKEFTEQTVIDGISYPVKKRVTAYEFATINETFFDGCHNTEYLLVGFTLSEAYHQLINLHSRKNNNRIEIPSIISREGNVWNLSDLDAIQELKLHDLRDGKFKITLYSCT
ncbi:hypothetical protein ACFOSV_06805 [Algoriphagus namhaensis]|uniref:SH3 domain-containing protein n=1 Tax=Algoriphagus namhaensis TaxID=915353 RepID=A0ABV8AQF5_9BACT